MIRQDWTQEEIREIYRMPLLELMSTAGEMHRRFHNPGEVQLCTLLSVKTGGCAEDCAYCPQAARYQTGVKASRMLDVDEVVTAAKKAKEAGSSRFCMGAAWRQLRDNAQFDKVIKLVEAVNALDLEVCCSMGMMSEDQAHKLKEAGAYAYNHNLDTSPEYYEKIISTREYEDRLETLGNIRKAGMTVCCGGILGMGESEDDRVSWLHTLATLPEHPESVPINALLPIKGTPLGEKEPISIWELVRMIATTRLVIPTALIRLSAGRQHFSNSDQALAFLCGANSIHTGEKLLTQKNCGGSRDAELIEQLGLKPMPARAHAESTA